MLLGSDLLLPVLNITSVFYYLRNIGEAFSALRTRATTTEDVSHRTDITTSGGGQLFFP